ncbi:MAG: hypothetical protein IKA36_05865 [Clostridia bacterium]|nr:hypothetical protein [Clostridia bacterium]
MNDKDEQLYKEIMKRFNDLCAEELSFYDHERMICTLVSNSKGFKNKPPYQKEPFVTNTPAGIINGFYEYNDGSEYAVEEYVDALYRQCEDEIKDRYLEQIFHQHKSNEEMEQRISKINNHAQG